MKSQLIVSEKKCSNNLKELLKLDYQVISTLGKNIVLGKSLTRLIYNPDTDEVESTYVLNK
jgi:hypothetical protein